MTLAARHAQTQGTTLSIRQHVELAPEAAPAEAEDGLRLSFLGRARRARVRAPDRAAPPHGGQIWIGLPVGHPARPDTPVAPVGLATVDLRFSYSGGRKMSYNL